MTSTETTPTRTQGNEGAVPGKPRVVEGVYRQPRLHWVGDGFRVAGYFNVIPDAAKKLSPFLLLDYHPTYEYAPSMGHRRGVGVHPHRGFETVTLAFSGSVAHHDSTGAGGVIGPGDVQWMTAASGILHKEYHADEFAYEGGPFQVVQLWVNLPRAHKMSAPRYQGIEAKEMGVLTLPNGGGTVRVVAGELHGVRGPAETFTPVNLFDARLRAGAELVLPLPAHHNASILVMDGAVSLDGREVEKDDFVVFANEGERVVIKASADAQLLVMSGEPIDEPLVQYGPFAMNTQEEIAEAYRDFRAGKFGHLAD